MNYSVGFDRRARDDLQRLSPQPKQEVNKVLKRLRAGPDLRTDIQLQEADGLWRALAGRRWRVIFSVGPGRHIQIRRIRRRPDAYQGIEHPGRQELREAEASYEAAERVPERTGGGETAYTDPRKRGGIVTTPEGLTREEREQYWREQRMAQFPDDPEMREFIRTAKFDYESTPEEDAEDIRISRERLAKGKFISLDEFLRWMDEECPDKVENPIPD